MTLEKCMTPDETQLHLKAAAYAHQSVADLLAGCKRNNVKAPTKLEQQNYWLSGYEGFKAGYKAKGSEK